MSAHTLLVRLVGPMQAWGTDSRFGLRDTHPEPSRSGVTGLLCAALGWDRAAPTHEVAGRTLSLETLAAWRFGVRVVAEGLRVRDFHTAGKAAPGARVGFRRASGATEARDVIISDRFYLADAAFIAGFEADDRAVLEAIHAALQAPVWPLSLGRRSCPPALPVHLGVVPAPLVEALLTVEDEAFACGLYASTRPASGQSIRPPDRPGLASEARANGAAPQDASMRRLPPGRLVLDADVDASTAEALGYLATRDVRRADVPRAFAPRRFDARLVRIFEPPASDAP